MNYDLRVRRKSDGKVFRIPFGTPSTKGRMQRAADADFEFLEEVCYAGPAQFDPFGPAIDVGVFAALPERSE